ncbi:MAG: sigma-70 family RNA polymerase sigma factor [Oscillospiraceae bacterium]|nr:sigma-70 family RNA polymerase sigma factor [Oscillospiraceae bacterium]
MLFFALQLDNDNRAFFSHLYETYEKKMFFVAMNVCGNQWIAEDAVHDAFFKAAQHISELRTFPEKRVGAWLMVVCKNAALDILRKEARYVPAPDNIEDISFESPEMQFEYAELVSAIKTLPAEQRTLLELKYIEGRSHGEIAKAFGISNTAARLRVLRAKQDLRRILEKGESHGVK